jgi:hypothetical protein
MQGVLIRTVVVAAQRGGSGRWGSGRWGSGRWGAWRGGSGHGEPAGPGHGRSLRLRHARETPPGRLPVGRTFVLDVPAGDGGTGSPC